MLQFKNQSLNKDYIINSKSDVTLHTPDGYRGALTDIPKAEILDGLIARKTNLVTKRQAEASVPAPAPAPAPEVKTNTGTTAGIKPTADPVKPATDAIPAADQTQPK